MTTVSSAGDSIEANSAAASAAMNFADEEGRLLMVALWVAEVMDEEDMSMPREVVKRAERVMVKRPEPE